MSSSNDRMLDPAELARFTSLELLARTVVDGVMGGLHRSPRFGYSQEFSEYRAYNEGDDPRFIDWNVFARTDRMYVKRFVGDTRTSMLILLDASASMRFGSGDVTKFEYARYLSAALAMIARKQLDAPGLVVFNQDLSHWQAPASRPGTVPRILATLENAEPKEGTDLVAAVESVHSLASQRGMLVVISDFYCDPTALGRALQPFGANGHDIALFHIADSHELAPDVDAISRMEDMESGSVTTVTPDYLAIQYTRAFESHREALRRESVKLSAHYTLADTSQPLDHMLISYLRFRQGAH